MIGRRVTVRVDRREEDVLPEDDDEGVCSTEVVGSCAANAVCRVVASGELVCRVVRAAVNCSMRNGVRIVAKDAARAGVRDAC